MKGFMGILGLVFLLYTPCTIGQTPDSFFIGAIRSDGVLIPFALYDSGKWSSPWPGHFDRDSNNPLNDSTITTLSQIPPSWAGSLKIIPSQWWKPGVKGDSSLTVTRPVIVPSYCTELWALLLSGRQPPINTHRYLSTIGIAASEKITYSPCTRISSGSPEWKDVSLFIQSQAQKKVAETGSPLSKEGNAAVKTNIATLSRIASPFQGHYYYYFEIEKVVFISEPTANRYTCHTLSGRGWIRKDRSGAFTLTREAFFRTNKFPTTGNESYEMGPGDIPLGSVFLNNDMYVVIDDNRYESELYIIYQVCPSGIKPVISFFIGGC
jgi:hypothetical protein